jgi:tetratricopeptide (TPR) repeat protein
VVIANSKFDWENIEQESKEKLDNLINKNDIIKEKFKIAISLANQGEIVESHNKFKEINDLTSKENFYKIVNPYIKKLGNNSNNILYLNYAAFSYVIAEDYKSSIKHFKRIIELNKTNVSIMNFLAASYIQINNFDKARNYIKKGRKIKNSDFASFLMGYIQYKKGNYFRSLREFSKSGSLFNHYIIN